MAFICDGIVILLIFNDSNDGAWLIIWRFVRDLASLLPENYRIVLGRKVIYY